MDARFGMSVAIDGDQIIVGSEFDDVDGINGVASNAGSAYVFRFDGSTWEEESHITASDYGQSENFGWAVDVSGDYAVVGAYKNDTDEDGLNSSPDAGAAYVYERGSGLWPQVSKIVGSDRANIDFFGYDVSINDETIAVGAYQQDRDFEGNVNWTDAGAVYVYGRNSNGEWLETQKITHAERITLDQLGYSVDIDSDDIISGASLEDEDENLDNPLPDAGSVFLFNKSPNSIYEYANTEFTIYPNPAKDELIVTGKGFFLKYDILDASGRLVVSERAIRQNSLKINVNNLSSGLYSLFINNRYAQKFSVVR